MLSFWILAALLTVIAVLVVVRPLTLRPESVALAATPRAAADVAVYRERLAEIEADHARGLIGAAEAEAARVETARRLLASNETAARETAHSQASPGERKTSERLFFVVALLIPAVALGFYALLGSPSLPDRPVAERLASGPSAGADVEEIIARVEARLRAEPRDGQGWDVLAPVYLRLERFQDAAEAFRRAIEIQGESVRRLSGLAESLVLASDGIVTEPARRAYQRMLELEPGRFDARLGLALAKDQDGDLGAAEAEYRKLAEAAPPQAPWRAFLEERIEAIAQRRGKQPAPEAVPAETIAGLPEGQRREAILSMVEGLAERLKSNGHDIAGWQRLIRSWTVLGETAKAEATLADARKALAGDSSALAEINAFAKSLGLKT